MINQYRISITSIALTVAVLAAALTWNLLSSEDRQSSGQSPRTLVAHAADHLPNATAGDWVTYADHVVLVSPIVEHVLPPTARDVERGEGVIERTLDMQVDEILWSRPGGVEAPSIFNWQAFGWQFSDGDQANRVPLAAEDAPRLEIGHQYVLAIRWEEARCTSGDYVPAQWQGLGADAIVPADGGVIGQGELQGEVQTVSVARAQADTEASLEDRMVGRQVEELKSVLETAEPVAPLALPSKAMRAAAAC